jgi:histidinol-phosphate aminotransferase
MAPRRRIRLDARNLVRPLVRDLHPYTPGEQPRIRNLIKLNTNENPYPPSPKVLRALRSAADDRLRLYPNPTADGLRARLAKIHGCTMDNIIVGNGSDELLAMAVRCFVEPAPDDSARNFQPPDPRSTVQFFCPSYSLYPVLADIHGAAQNRVALAPDFGLPNLEVWRRERPGDFQSALTFVTTPNAPSGRGYSVAELRQFCAELRGVVVMDEAYVDFADEHAAGLAFEFPHVLVSRTFSKAYSLCFQRVGYMLGHRDLIGALHKIRDSYNVNGLGQVAAEATLSDLPYYHRNFRRVQKTRARLQRALSAHGFSVLPSQANFLLVQPPLWPAQRWMEWLRKRRILVRWFSASDVNQYLRISIGTDEDTDRLIAAIRLILRQKKMSRLRPPEHAHAL